MGDLSSVIDGQEIVKLYSDYKLSMQQIADKLHISSSGVRHHLVKHGIHRRSLSEAIFSINATRFGKEAFKLKNITTTKDRELLIAGTMLYWGEGAKKGGTVNFVNSNPEMIVVFLRFLRKICGISEDRLKALIHLYPDHDEERLINFWSKVTQIPRKRFYRSFVHIGKAGTYKRRSQYGTLALSYSDKRLLNTILAWIDEYKSKLGK
ncbi:MAG: hypothetical protein NUV80_07160 [Candidatus Berkelbacteria bacterium]|nr:hypothetical protein [Candidatus Berkelbacteria bacterium]MCR4308303.1 hypothetical protein [Candidatus Berkelbacteria bacterium]